MFNDSSLKQRAHKLFPDVFNGNECWDKGWEKIKQQPKNKQKEIITKFFKIFPNSKDLIKLFIETLTIDYTKPQKKFCKPLIKKHIELLKPYWPKDKSAARDAAWYAARNASRYAAWYAARYAARDAARNAAWDASRYATWYAARYATWDAARYATWYAARYAAWIIAKDLLKNANPFQPIFDLLKKGIVFRYMKKENIAICSILKKTKVINFEIKI